MDYILQVERIISFLKLNYDASNVIKIELLKTKFHMDFNLLGCFFKDFIIMKTSESFSDELLYDRFVLYFDTNIKKKNAVLSDLLKFGQYYLMIVFEEIENVEILSSVSTINLCYCIECYPLLMKIFDEYFNSLIDNNNTIIMLKSLVNVVLKNFESENSLNVDFYKMTLDNIKTIENETEFLGRIAV